MSTDEPAPAAAETDMSESDENADPGASTQSDVTELLSAVDYGNAAENFFWNAVEYVSRKTDPIYAVMSTYALRPGVAGVTVEIGGKVVESPQVPIAYDLKINTEDMVKTNIEALATVIHEAAMSKLEQVGPAYQQYMDESLDAVGNNVKTPKAGHNWDRVFDLLEKVEWSEGTDGLLHPPQMHSGSEVPDLPQQTPSQMLRYNDIYTKKQEEHVARRRSRRLR